MKQRVVWALKTWEPMGALGVLSTMVDPTFVWFPPAFCLLCDLQHLPGHKAEPRWTRIALATGRLADTL